MANAANSEKVEAGVRGMLACVREALDGFEHFGLAGRGAVNLSTRAIAAAGAAQSAMVEALEALRFLAAVVGKPEGCFCEGDYYVCGRCENPRWGHAATCPQAVGGGDCGCCTAHPDSGESSGGCTCEIGS